MPRGPVVAVLLLSTLLSSPARAVEPVEALLRQRAEAFVGAMSAGDRTTLEAFARDHLESRVAREGIAGRFADRMIETRTELGPVERHSVQVLRGGALVFVYCKHAKSGAWQNYQFRVVAGDDHRLQLVFRAVAIEPLERPGAPLGSEEADRWLGRFQARLEEQQPFSGIALVRSRGREAYSLVKGKADATNGVPVTRRSRFGMASGSKMFTAVAVLQLAQRGRLSLADPLAKHLPGFPNPEFAKRATLHQLLTHTAGAGNYWDDAYEREWDRITELRQMLPFVLAHLGASPAGEFSYSNSGYVLLGLVIEAVSGTSYYDYVRKSVFEPAGMASTGFPVRTDATPDEALPYEPEMDAGAVKPGVYVPVTLGARGSSAGGASTTADDLLRFVDALRKGVLLDPAHLELMTRGHVRYGGADSWYGYGTIVEKDRGVLSWGHGGMARGTQFELKVYPERDAVMLVLSNYNTIAGPEMASALDHLVRNPER
jgi:CubicO group peptidase (beta-lactamase class C family)